MSDTPLPQSGAEPSDEHQVLREGLARLFEQYTQAFGAPAAQLLRADLQDLVMKASSLARSTGGGASLTARSMPAAAVTSTGSPAILDDRQKQFPEIITQSSKMKEIFDLILKVAPTTTTVLIQGESGTGKELVARAIHQHSARHQGPFVAENCAALPETLLESELFGHAKGAFTGADRSRKGRFMMAHTGTLFLDEVGDMSQGMQKKLLRALQEGEIRPVGSNTTVKVDVRFLSASNKDLQQLVNQGKFREDLFYRLCPIRIQLPPLRERGEDVVLLAHSLVPAIAREARVAALPLLTEEVLDLFRRYRWPGNVRELRNELQRIVALSQPGKPIRREDLSADIRTPEGGRSPQPGRG